MLQDPVTDEKVANSLRFRRDYIDIYQISWGHNDGETFDGPGRLTQTVLMDGANKGRNGLGSIFVSASGTGNEFFDDCNAVGYTSSIYTMSISSVKTRFAFSWVTAQFNFAWFQLGFGILLLA